MMDLAQVLVRDMDSRIIMWNQGAERLYGFTAAEAIGRVSHDLFNTRFPAPLAKIEECLLKKNRWEGELIHTARDGHRVVVASLWVLHRDADGHPVSIIEANNDVTGAKEAGEALRESFEKLQTAQDQLVQSEKLAAVGRMSAGIAHELGNPLATISSSADILAEIVAGEESLDSRRKDVARHLEKIEAHIVRAKGILDGLLGFVRRGGGEETSLDVGATVERALALVQADPRTRNRRLVLTAQPLSNVNAFDSIPGVEKLPEPRLRVRGRAGQLEQVFVNLLQNAIDATGTDGRIVVSYSERRAEVHVAIGDDGPGVSPEQMRLLFEPFHTTKESGKGTGLGLYVSHQIVAACGGKLECESLVGKGTIMRARFPGAPEMEIQGNGTANSRRGAH